MSKLKDLAIHLGLRRWWILLRVRLGQARFWLMGYKSDRTDVQDNYDTERIMRILHECVARRESKEQTIARVRSELFPIGVPMIPVFRDSLIIGYESIQAGRCNCEICKELHLPESFHA